MVFPAGEVFKIVFTQNHFKLMPRVPLPQVCQRDNGVTRLGQMKLGIVDFKLWIVGDGGPHQIVPVKFVQQAFAWLQRVLRGDDKPDFFQVAVFHHDVGNRQMPDMNGVEGAEVQADFQVAGVNENSNWAAFVRRKRKGIFMII